MVSAKVVAKSRTKQLRFGFITMATVEEAQQCIKELGGTELKGKKITVELVGEGGEEFDHPTDVLSFPLPLSLPSG